MLTLFACAVCGAGDDPAKSSYVVMSLIISGLPLLMLGGIIAWLVSRSRSADAQVARETEDAGART